MDLAEQERTLARLAAELQRARGWYQKTKLDFKRARGLQDTAFYEYSNAVSRYNRFVLVVSSPTKTC